MKKLLKFTVVLLLTLNFQLLTYGQTPNQFKYQAVLRNADGSIMANEDITVDISILQGSTTGTSVFDETHTVTTTAQGIINLNIGSENDLSVIDWSADVYFIRISVNGTEMGTSQLLSVPYAMIAKNVENDQVDDADADPSNEIQDLSGVLTQSNDAGAKQIKNIADPTEDQDAVTKVYADAIIQVIENNGLTVVDFSTDHTIITEGDSINFTDNSAINPTSWLWDFGDGNTSTEQNPTHIYANTGTYTISLTASNGAFTKTETKTDYITVIEALTDYDGNTYQVVQIGNQLWMAEDLRVTHYPNGDPIPNVTDNTDWENLADNNTDDAYCFYNNDSNTDYGALYTYAAVIGDDWVRDNIDGQGVCPDGWHLPTDAEWKTLEMSLGMSQTDADNSDWRGTDEGGKMKETGTTHWNSPNTGATNSSGFSALPGSGRNADDGGTFGTLGANSMWWSATEYTGSYAYRRILSYDNAKVYRGYVTKSGGFSVRCVRD